MKNASRRSFLKLAAASLGATAVGNLVGCGAAGSAADAGPDAGGTEGGPSTSSTKKPNILLIVVDQERSPIFSPKNLSLTYHEKLVAQGTSFDLHHANAMPCTPSRSVLYTGQHVQQTRMVNNIGPTQGSMSTKLPTLGSMLKDIGYRTAYFGKWHLSSIDAGDNCSKPTTEALVPYGFDVYNRCGDLQGNVMSGYKDDPGVADSTLEWLGKQSPSDASWFLSVDFVNPHDVMFYYPGGFAAPGVRTFGFDAPDDPLYKAQWDITLPPHYNEDLSSKPPAQIAYARLYDTFQRYVDGPRGIEARQAFVNYYFNCLRDVDRHMGRVLDALAKSPFADNTIVVFTSDHGEFAFSHGLRGKGPSIYKENNHVPLSFMGPGIPKGAHVRGLSSHVDLAPTLLALGGQTLGQSREKYPALKGVDLSASVRSPSTPTTRSDLLMCFDFGGTTDISLAGPGAPDTTSDARRPFLRGIADGRYKFARYFASSDYHVPTTWTELLERNDLELYDLTTDPTEVVNLAKDPEAHKALIEGLNAKLNALVNGEAGGEIKNT